MQQQPLQITFYDGNVKELPLNAAVVIITNEDLRLILPHPEDNSENASAPEILALTFSYMSKHQGALLQQMSKAMLDEADRLLALSKEPEPRKPEEKE